MIMEARGILNCMENVFVEHHFGDDNILADYLPNEVVSLNELAILEENFPYPTLELALKEMDVLVFGGSDDLREFRSKKVWAVDCTMGCGLDCFLVMLLESILEFPYVVTFGGSQDVYDVTLSCKLLCNYPSNWRNRVIIC